MLFIGLELDWGVKQCRWEIAPLVRSCSTDTAKSVLGRHPSAENGQFIFINTSSLSSTNLISLEENQTKTDDVSPTVEDEFITSNVYSPVLFVPKKMKLRTIRITVKF